MKAQIVACTPIPSGYWVTLWEWTREQRVSFEFKTSQSEMSLAVGDVVQITEGFKAGNKYTAGTLPFTILLTAAELDELVWLPDSLRPTV